MKPNEFVKAYYPFARESEAKTGISAVFTLAQAAIESEWGESAPGNMFFGIKDTDGLNGNEQKILTTEYSLKGNLKPKDLGLFEFTALPEPVVKDGIKRFKYKGHALFRKYNTPKESFDDHSRFFFENPRYKRAIEHRTDAEDFAKEIVIAGYATGPQYLKTLLAVIKMIQKELKA